MRVNTSTGRRWATALISLGLLASGLTAATATAAAPSILTAPRTERTAKVVLWAASDQYLLASFGGSFQLSSDSGVTWQAAALPYTACSEVSCGIDGSLYSAADGLAIVVDEDDENPMLYDLATNQASPVVLADGERIDRAIGGIAIVADDDWNTGSQVRSLTGDSLDYRLPTGWYPYSLDLDGSVLAQYDDGDWKVFRPNGQQLSVASADYASSSLSDGLLWYTTWDDDQVRLCVSEPGAGEKSCQPIPFEVDSVVRSVPGFLVYGEGGELVRVNVSGGALAASTTYTSTPGLSLAEFQQGDGFWAGGWGKLLHFGEGAPVRSDVPAAVESAPLSLFGLTPTTLLGTTETSDSVISGWTRSIGTELGAESTLAGVTAGDSWRATASVSASAGRWLASNTEWLRWFDDATPGEDQTPAQYLTIRQQSGSYALVTGFRPESGSSGSDVTLVVRPDGTQIETPNAIGIYGSLVLEQTDSTLRVRDLSGRTATVTLPDFSAGYRIVGDWVVSNFWDEDSDEDIVFAYNYRTGVRKKGPANSLLSVGDGIAVLWGDEGGEVKLWWFADNATETLDGIDRSVVPVFDGNRIAYATSTDVVVKQLDGIGTSAPRVLSVLANSEFIPEQASWTAEVDLSKPVDAGTLQIVNQSGTVVREIPVEESLDGSLRDLSWDGRNTGGVRVPDGTYQLKFTNQASDGSGAVVGIDGAVGTQGSVTVSSKTFASAPTPTISGTAKVGGVLTAKPGTWAPTPTKLSYQWLRNGKPISGATAATYTLAAADVNASVSVRVTATLAGYLATSSTAKAVKVSAGSFSKAPVPTISGTAKFGSVLSAKPGTWSPGATLSYQWLRNGKPISKATAAKYTLTAADIGSTVTVRVRAVRAGYTTTDRISSKRKVIAASFAKTATPKISGKAKVKRKLTVKVGTWSPKPTKVKYQWLRNGKAIAKATKASYTVVAKDKGKRISVKVTFTKTGYASVVKTSAKTAKVVK